MTAESVGNYMAIVTHFEDESLRDPHCWWFVVAWRGRKRIRDLDYLTHGKYRDGYRIEDFETVVVMTVGGCRQDQWFRALRRLIVRMRYRGVRQFEVLEAKRPVTKFQQHELDAINRAVDDWRNTLARQCQGDEDEMFRRIAAGTDGRIGRGDSGDSKEAAA